MFSGAFSKPFTSPFGGQPVAAAAPYLLFDEFTDTNNTSMATHAPAPYRLPGVNWQIDTGAASVISSNRATITSGFWASVSYDAGVSDCTVECDFNDGDNGAVLCGLALRRSGLRSSLYAAIREDLGGIYLYRDNDGDVSALAATAYSYTRTTTVHLKAVLLGSSVKVYINDVLYIDTTTTFNQSATAHGYMTLFTYATMWWDDFKISV